MTATEPHHTWEDRFAEHFARVGAWSSIGSAIILTAVLIANGVIILLNVVLGALLALAQLGPVVSSVLGAVGTAATQYARLRIVRGKEQFSLKDEVVDKALDAPGNLQNLPNQLRNLGCFSRVSVALLLTSLVVWFLTAGPQPLAVLGFGQNGGFKPVTVVITATPLPTTATAIPTATATIPPTATAIPPVVNFALKPAANSDQCYAAASSYTVTLDNTGSNVAVSWQATIPDTLKRSGHPWASLDAMSGTIPAGQTATVTVQPNNTDDVCADASLYAGQQHDYHIDFTLNVGQPGPYTATDTITYKPIT